MDPKQPSSAVDSADRRAFLRRAAATAPLFVVGSAAIGLPTLLAATAASAQTEGGTPGSGGAGSTTTTAAPFTALPTTDLELLHFLESLERAGTVICDEVVATKAFDSADNEVFRLFGRHHTDQANALRTAVEADKAGADRYGKVPAAPNPTLLTELRAQITTATQNDDRAETATLATTLVYDLQNALAATCLFALGVLETQAVAGIVASILPVHSQQAVVLGQMLELPSADDLPSFERDADALSQSAYALD